jgi:putative endonuclease
MKDPRIERGRVAEDAAALWLEEHGWKVLDRNVRRPFGELDIVVLKGPTLGFVEVRSHTGDYLDWATDSINVEKQDKVRRMANWYLEMHPTIGREAIFIAVGVKLDGAGHAVVEEVVEDAF